MSGQLRLQEGESDPSYCKFGVGALAKLLDLFEAQIAGVIESEDIEYIHKMRVTSRRTRAVMPLFKSCFPQKKFKNWLQELKKVTRLLGEARDLDVQIAFVQQYLKKLGSPVELAGMEFLLKNHQDRRASIQPKVVEGLNELKNSRVLFCMKEFCEQETLDLGEIPFCSHVVLKQACWHILSKLNDFLAMEEYVHREAEILKHHEMRIRAKWLRYTMEAFSPLYSSKLAHEIEVVKGFQDVLGEMHDCDVWIDYIPKVVTEAKTKIINEIEKQNQVIQIENALLKFSAFMMERRKSNYAKFVQLWEETKEKKIFENLQETIRIGYMMDENLSKSLANPDIRIAVLADIHANLDALETVIQDAEKKGATFFLNAGDSVGYGPFPAEVLELLLSKNVISILGNYDLEVLENVSKGSGLKRFALEFAKKELKGSFRSCLVSYPREVRLEVTGKKVLLVHGSPESIDEHIYHDTPVEHLKTLSDGAKADIVIVGHSHEQFHRKVDGVSFVNPGSVGRPSDGNPQTAYAIIGFNPFSVELFRLSYDVASTADAVRKKGMPESFAQMILRGVSLEAIIKEDLARKDDLLQNCEKMVAISQKVSKGFVQDTEHSEQVRRLALDLFDGLEPLHHLGKRERCLLECAAILHDIGLSEGSTGHHKNSMTLILNDIELPFSSEEKQIIASVARYHRKGIPKIKQPNLATLRRGDVQMVMVLAGLLRLADGLDYCHESIVKSLTVKMGPRRVAVECLTNSLAFLEEQAFDKKKDLFEKVFKKKLVLICKQQL